jgi:hypothetical protein
MRRGPIGLFILAATLGACGGDGDANDGGADVIRVDAPRGEAPRVELGTGRTSFVEIPEAGAELELVAGPQGGWHIDVTTRLYDLAIEQLLLTYEITRDGDVVSMPRQFMLREALVLREGDHYLRAGDFVPFEITQPADIVGDTVVVRVTAEAVDGARAEDQRTVTIVDEE